MTEGTEPDYVKDSGLMKAVEAAESEPVTPKRRVIRLLHYRCQNPKCFGDGPKEVTNATDKVGEGEPFPKCIVCPHCHGGLRMTPESQEQRGEGLRFLYEETIDLHTGEVISKGVQEPWAGKGSAPAMVPYKGDTPLAQLAAGGSRMTAEEIARRVGGGK